MNISEIFENLIEIQSIYKDVQKHQSIIEEESKRLLFLKKQQNLKEREYEEIHAQIITYQNELNILEEKCFLSEQNIEKSKAAQSAATNNDHLESATTQMKLFQEKYQKDSEQLFEIMQKIEDLKPEQKKLRGFLDNFTCTYLEIENEVKTTSSNENEIICELQKRIDSILQNCPTYIQTLYKNLLKHYKNPIMFVGLDSSENCQGCFQRFERSLLENVHGKKGLETCPNCGRILVPYNN